MLVTINIYSFPVPDFQYLSSNAQPSQALVALPGLENQSVSRQRVSNSSDTADSLA